MPLHDFENEELRQLKEQEDSFPDLYSPQTVVPFMDLEQSLRDLARLDEMGLQFKYFIAPNVLVWELTGGCPLKCPFCISSYPAESDAELTSEEKKALARELVEAKIWGINLSGGEPLLCPDLPWLVDFFTRHEIPTLVVTSGWKLSEDLAAYMMERDEFSGFLFSIDAPVAEVHDELRGREGAFEEAVKGLKMLQRMGKQHVGVECVITQKNIQYMDEMVEFCRSLSVPQLRFQPVVLAGRGADRSDLSLSEKQLRALSNKVRDMRKRLVEEIIAHPEKPRVQVHLGDQTTHIVIGAKTGRNFGGIVKPDGTLRVSGYLHYTFGNIRQAGGFMNLWRDGFKVAWKHPELQEVLAGIKTVQDLERAAKEVNYTVKNLDVRECLAALEA